MNMSYAVARRSVLLSIFLAGVAAQAQATPHIVSTSSRYEGAAVRYYFEVENWTVTDRDRNPCVSTDSAVSRCVLYLSIRHPPSRYTAYYARWEIPIRRSSTGSGELLSDLQKLGVTMPITGSILVPQSYPSNELCFGFVWAHIGPNLGGAHNDWGSWCNRVVAPPLSCSITGNSTITHTPVSDREVNMSTASTVLNVQCSGPSSVTVTASRPDSRGVPLRGDGSLFSKITVNGADATSGVNVGLPDGRNGSLNIVSKLSSSGTVTPGPFSGSTVITVSPP